MSKWNFLRSKIIWPQEFCYVIENEGYENKFGYSYIVKYNGNIVHKNLKRNLNNIEKLLNITNDICMDIEEENNRHDSDDLEYDIDAAFSEMNKGNQIMLRLNDKKEFLQDKISKVNTINERFDIIIKNEPTFIFRLDWPFLDVESNYLTEHLKREFFKENMMKKKKKKSKNNKTSEEIKYKTYLYNIKIMESEESIIENREFFHCESNIENLKIYTIINEGKNIKNILYEYKEYCKNTYVYEEDESANEKENENEKKKEKEICYEKLSILPYSDIILLKKRYFDKEINIAGFLTPFILSGNIKNMIQNIDQYLKYEFDSKMIYKNLCNIIKLMDYLENHNIIHGNIKPTNLFISNDGYNLLIGNFIPKIKLVNFYFHVIHKKKKTPKYISPELLFYLNKKIEIVKTKKKKIKHIEKYFIKNDIFCLGLCFYYILTMKEDIINYIDSEQIFQFKVENLQKYITKPKLFFLLKDMLTYNHKHRPSWSTLLKLINDSKKKKKNDETN
ncbi:protein kinase, putative [Plasmodium relictum]|uniref:non-specific serine/threonine protein kinase n=1 Tax=Plasmodium relictum TaxID=85471 RepID=A0A1J1HA21_PLARL|nr:protein kinase, putative [Plasmodium relictum]CRH01764.1 protein kinase, putative [Plasmodium relictum]